MLVYLLFVQNAVGKASCHFVRVYLLYVQNAVEKASCHFSRVYLLFVQNAGITLMSFYILFSKLIEIANLRIYFKFIQLP